MSNLNSDSRTILWSAALFVAVAACGSSGSVVAGGQNGSSTGGTPGAGGTVNGTGGFGSGGMGRDHGSRRSTITCCR